MICESVVIRECTWYKCVSGKYTYSICTRGICQGHTRGICQGRRRGICQGGTRGICQGCRVRGAFVKGIRGAFVKVVGLSFIYTSIDFWVHLLLLL